MERSVDAAAARQAEPRAGAFVIELLDDHGQVVRRERVDLGEIEIGRSYRCDLVVDDAYLCPVHARIFLREEGIRVENLSDVNGVVNAGGERVETIDLQPETVVRLGSTTMRIRPLDYEMPVAKVYVDGARPGGRARWRSALAALGAALLLGLWETWSTSVRKLEWEETLLEAFWFAIGISIWAGVWAFVSRVFRRRPFFFDHLRVISLMLVVIAAWSLALEWVLFWIAADEDPFVLNLVFAAVAVAATLYSHLRWTSRRPHRLIPVALAVVVIAIGLVMERSGEDEVTYFPSHFDQLKPVPAGWLPKTSLDRVYEKADALRASLDDEVRKALEEDAASAAE